MQKLCVFMLAMIILGCGDNQPSSHETVVTGKVILDGVVLTMGEVYFESEDGKQSGRGEILSSGTYRVPSAPLGKVKCAVRTSNYAQYAREQTKGGKALTIGTREGTFVAVPKKYEDLSTSGLMFDLKPDSTLDIELTAK